MRVTLLLAGMELVAVGCSARLEAPTPPIETFASTACTNFFPGARFFAPAEGDDFLKAYLGGALQAFGEPCLPPGEVGPSEVYRFLWLRTFDPPVLVRMERWGDRTLIIAKVASERILRDAPKRSGHDAIAFGPKAIGNDELEQFNASLEMSGFWSLPERPDSSEGLDGAEWVLEGWRDGKYHVVSVWSPRDPGPYVRLADTCMTMVRLAGVSIDDKRMY